VLFNGSLRDNLDPFGSHTDDELLTALRQVHLAEYVSSNGGLDMAITASSGSYSLSLGQAQLVSLARAVLNPSPLLILDEATSALDLETDRLVQQTIRSVFASRTVSDGGSLGAGIAPWVHCCESPILTYHTHPPAG
jgi:ATP-binding cassette, subfamily C (CFTR/MRP), member 1